MSDTLALQPWGKLNRDNPAQRLTLVGHCIDVAACAQTLMRLPTWKRRLDTLAGRELLARDLDRLTVLAFLHDTGKAGAGFYSKALTLEVQRAWVQQCAYGNERQRGHTVVVAPLFCTAAGLEAHRAALSMEAIQRWGGTDEDAIEATLDLWLASVSHHGDPISLSSLSNITGGRETWLHGVAGYEPLQGLKQLGQVARSLWPDAFAAEPMATPPSQGLIHAFAGLVSLADWIGSNTDFFPYGDPTSQGEERWDTSLAIAKETFRAMRLDVEAARADLQARAPLFETVFPFSPLPMQTQGALATLRSPVILEAETGSGKTEAALWRFKELFEAGEVDALCFLLPTRVAASGIYTRLQEFNNKLFPDPALRPSTVLAVPSYLLANGVEGQRLAPFDVLWPDTEERAPLYWAAEHSKRYFAASAAAATIDQFLLSTLQTKHAHMRGTLLLRTLVVVDEVHASDTYMRALLVKALRRHLAAGGHAMLLSATLTQDACAELLRTAPQLPSKRARFGAPVPLALSTEYPRITAPGLVQGVQGSLRTKQVQQRLAPIQADANAVASLAAAAASQGARVLVLRNTVGQAVATQQALEALLREDHPALFRCHGIVALHHGRYALPDRLLLDAAVAEQFGKAAATTQSALVLCATQTVEISVDCDADFLITDLAPMDVLLQRIGRLHRHAVRDAYRPKAFKTPQCAVLTPNERDLSRMLKPAGARGTGLGGKGAYPNLLCVEATLRALENQVEFPCLDIPRQNRALVESSCCINVLAALAESMGDQWPAHWNELQGRASAQGSQAHYSSIDWLKPWNEAVAGELSADARTRLGLDGIDVELPQPWHTPFDRIIDRLTLPVWMLPTRAQAERSDHLQVHIDGASKYELRFTVDSRAFAYSRLGLTAINRNSTAT